MTKMYPQTVKKQKVILFRDLAAANTNQDQLKNVISATEDVNNMWGPASPLEAPAITLASALASALPDSMPSHSALGQATHILTVLPLVTRSRTCTRPRLSHTRTRASLSSRSDKRKRHGRTLAGLRRYNM